MTTKNRDVLQSLWDFFCSLKLTMFLLITLAITSIIGTIIPQGAPPPEYVAQISATKLQVYKTLGFFDMYHSWWFILLLYLLTVNLVACSIKRLPHILKIITHPTTTLSSGQEQSIANVASIKSSEQPEALKDRISSFLKSEFAQPVITEVDGAWHLFAQKSPWCRLAVYIVHLSVIVIFIGAMIGSLFGYKGYVSIPEGETITKIGLRSGQELDLGFGIRCEQFSVSTYPNGAPKEFKSILTVLENGKPVPDYTNARVIVNDPLQYKGITFYQSSYGDAGTHFFTMTDTEGKNSVPVTVPGTDSVALPDGSSMHVTQATDDVSAFAPGLSGPAAQVEVHSTSGATDSFVVYANHPELNVSYAKQHGSKLVMHYKGAQKKMYTGLQVAKDPGVWVVWLGCFLMVIGVYVAFFMSHRRVWVRIQNGHITVAGNSSKNQAAFQPVFQQLVDKLTTDLTKEKTR
ncbi:cytochrome c biogenesis protein ResB [Pelotalea chapellei]|uniref:Cytochrome c biogenesis protein ResB n=1 Tax=Pelotalea chapellei TaxID=44671 RepID=A0ABS5U9X0_9BACT|nr:cytochrome c biogenesis protein ResB [Pelotalea chapellei]